MSLKKLLLICLSALSIPAFAQIPDGLNADWFLVGESADGKTTFYANRKTISRNGDIVRAWGALIMLESKNSAKHLMEINCKTNQQRDLSRILYTGIDFAKMDISSDKPTEWQHIIPDSTSDNRKNVLCSYRAK
jgi:uncharacterized protein YfdQ (DUF2303 family)